MLAKTTATLQRNMLNDIFDVVGPKGYKWVNRQTGELRILGRRIWLFGANNEDAEAKLRGATFAGALCDEVTLYPQSVFMQLLARCSVPGSLIFTNTNPDNPYHWFYTDFITNDTIVDKKIWHFTMEDNPSLTKQYIESLKQTYRGVWYERMVLGNWVAAEGRIYDMITSEHFIDTQIALNESNTPVKVVKYIIACDYGTSSVMTWGLYAICTRGIVLKVKEYYYDARKEHLQMSDGQFCYEFKKWLPDYISRDTTIYIDPSAASWKAELREAGFRVMDAKNDVINGIRYVGEQLASKKFLIDSSCVMTKEEYHTYVWDSNAQKQGIDKPLKINDHTCDCDRYALYTENLYGASGVYTERRRPGINILPGPIETKGRLTADVAQSRLARTR
jgi:PBSX family phage terminase large subunit